MRIVNDVFSSRMNLLPLSNFDRPMNTTITKPSLSEVSVKTPRFNGKDITDLEPGSIHYVAVKEPRVPLPVVLLSVVVLVAAILAIKYFS